MRHGKKEFNFGDASIKFSHSFIGNESKLEDE